MRNSHGARKAAVLGAVAAVLAACTASAPVMERWTPAPSGASWEVAQRNTGSYGKDAQLTWTREDTRWKGAPAIALRSSGGMTIMAEPVGGRWMAIVGAEGRPMLSYDPPIGWEYPLHVGKSWTTRERMTLHASGKTLEFDFNCKVEAFEKVTVRAGSFEAFRIHCTTSIGNDETYWISPGLGAMVKMQLRRDATNPFGAGTQDQELVRRPGQAPAA
jgi:hypothetical protein